MGKILDLSIFKEETLDITMMDGTTLHIMKPTQAMVIKVLQMRNINAESEPEKIVEAFNALVLSILNCNDAAKVFTQKDIEAIPMKAKTAIINAYSEFITGIQSDPN